MKLHLNMHSFNGLDHKLTWLCVLIAVSPSHFSNAKLSCSLCIRDLPNFTQLINSEF